MNVASVAAEWALPLNTLLLIVLALVNWFTHRRASKERQLVSNQVTKVAEAVADTRRVAKESHNSLVAVAEETTGKILSERRYDDSPGEDHRFKRRSTDIKD